MQGNVQDFEKSVQVACQLCKGGGGGRNLQNSRELFNRVCSIIFRNVIILQVLARATGLKFEDVCKGAGGEGVFVILFMAFSSTISTHPLTFYATYPSKSQICSSALVSQ